MRKSLLHFRAPTEWIKQGKAGVPVELGLPVLVSEDQYGFILSHRVMARESDDQVAVPVVEELAQRFPYLRNVSLDKGFHSPANQNAWQRWCPSRAAQERQMQRHRCAASG